MKKSKAKRRLKARIRGYEQLIEWCARNRPEMLRGIKRPGSLKPGK